MASDRYPVQNSARARPEAGFTLIELLVVVVIIGLLAAIAIPQYSVVKAKAGDATAKSDLRNLVTAEEKYYYDNQAYTDQLADLRTEGFSPSAGITLSIQTSGATFQADAAHEISHKCFWVTYGIGGHGIIEAVDNASIGNGDCSG